MSVGSLENSRWPVKLAVGLTALGLISAGVFILSRFLPLPVDEVQTFRLKQVSFADLPGWETDSIGEVLPALKQSCRVFEKRPAEATIGPDGVGGSVGQWQKICRDLEQMEDPSDRRLKTFLEEHLTPYSAVFGDEKKGTITGYYEARLDGSLTPTADYRYPVYGMPRDLVRVDLSRFSGHRTDGTVMGRVDAHEVVPYYSRAEIENGFSGVHAPVLLWARDPVDIFITHIQGSAQVDLTSGETVRIGFAASNGLPFKGIGSILLEKGLIPSSKASMPDIRKWLKMHPDEAERLMQENPRYIFFRFVTGTNNPVGALNVPLTPGRSLAVDPSYMPLGVPVWLDTNDPDGDPLQRLMVAQDIGSAIKGGLRGDFYWGSGEEAFKLAGRMKSRGRFFLLLPRSARELTLERNAVP